MLRLHELPGPQAFPESIGIDRRTGAFFTGSLVDGTIYRGTLDDARAVVWSPAGSDGRRGVAGVKVDERGRVWVADAFNARVLVYDQSAELLHVFVLEGPGVPTVNDLAFSHGTVYVTDSSRPFLYRVAESAADKPGTTRAEPWLAIDPPVAYSTGEGPLGVNLNGIVASPDGLTLVTIQTNAGVLYRVDVPGETVTRVETGDADLQFGDGLLRQGDVLYVARNAKNEIVRLRLEPGWSAAHPVSTITSPAFAFPTAMAAARGRLLVTNSQLDAAADPALPFTIADLPLH